MLPHRNHPEPDPQGGRVVRFPPVPVRGHISVENGCPRVFKIPVRGFIKKPFIYRNPLICNP